MKSLINQIDGCKSVAHYFFFAFYNLLDFYSASVESAFRDSGGDFDICINCAAETRYGQSEEVTNTQIILFHSSNL